MIFFCVLYTPQYSLSSAINTCGFCLPACIFHLSRNIASSGCVTRFLFTIVSFNRIVIIRLDSCTEHYFIIFVQQPNANISEEIFNFPSADNLFVFFFYLIAHQQSMFDFQHFIDMNLMIRPLAPGVLFLHGKTKEEGS